MPDDGSAPVLSRGAGPNRIAVYAVGAIIVLATLGLHCYSLENAPYHVHGDEVHFAVHAHSLATTGRDLNGRWFPVFFSISDPLVPNPSGVVWFQPVLFYVLAAVLTVLPINEASIRVAPALIGALDVLLMYVVARRLFPSLWEAAAAASLLALTPAHVIFSRVTADYICSVPFVIGWVLSLLAWIRTGQTRFLFIAGALLGVGFYSYIAAWVMMPFYVVVTCALVIAVAPRNYAAVLAVCGGFLVPLLLFAGWLWLHPTMLSDTFSRYHFMAPVQPELGARLVGVFASVSGRISLYWDYFNPGYLFLSGGSNPIDSTRRVGLFVVPVAVFLIAGVVHLWRLRHSPVQRLVLIGFFSAPLAAIVINERFCSDRELFLLPFAALVATYGLSSLWKRGARARSIAVAACLATPLQFGLFYYDYISLYPMRTLGLFDPFDFRQIADHVVDSDTRASVPAVFVSPKMSYAAYRWKFQLLARGRDDLFARTRYAVNGAAEAAPAGSLFIMSPNDPDVDLMLKTSRFVTDKTIIDASGASAAVVLRVVL